jgi:hypothetical protein
MYDPWTDRLSEYLDDELTPAERLDIDRHLLDCADCRETLDDLARVAAEARNVDDVAPARDLWPDVRRALLQPGARTISARDADAGALVRRAPWRVTVSLSQALAASVLIMLASGSAVWLVLDRRPPASVGARGDDAPIARPARLNDPRHDRAVADLMKILDTERPRLDPRTVTIVERNLVTIDRAIAEARTALERDPSDEFLSAYLAEQRRVKLTLLRQAASFTLAGE